MTATRHRTPARSIRVRRVRFDYPAGPTRRHFANDDLVLSHVVAVLSATFPAGEEYFIRSVRNLSGRIKDPELQKQVKGFIGQEVTHGREHRLLNERLAEMGYPTPQVDRHITRLLWLCERLLPNHMNLAGTAALEHYTATFAETLMTSERAQRLLGYAGNSEVRKMLLWHALEESEHKAVAFDVYKAAGGPEWLRIVSMDIASAIFWAEVIGQTVRSLAGDRAAYNPARLLRSVIALRKLPFLGPTPRKRFAQYHRPGFHPDEWDASELIDRWRTELFAEQAGAQ